jgi:hypothetical protein
MEYPPRADAVFLAIVLGLCLPTAPAHAVSQKATHKNLQQERTSYVPKDLEECLSELDKLLSAEDRNTIRSKAEDGLWEYHVGFGTGLRNDWGLWRHSRLAQYFEKIGVDHPESMTSIIIRSYWRRLNHQDIKLEEQLAEHRAAVEEARKEDAAERERVEQVLQEIPKLMLGYKYDRSAVPVVTMPRRNINELRVRFLAPYPGGVFLTARELLQSSGAIDTYQYLPHFFDDRDRKIHPIKIPDITYLVYSVVAGGGGWFAGMRNDCSPVLYRANPSEKSEVALPRTDEVPQLGLDGEVVLLIYSNAIFRFSNSSWQSVYSGEVKLPLSGPPPRQFGGKIYFRDEGHGENEKRLLYFDLQTQRLVGVGSDTGLVGPSGPRWENSFGYWVARDGTLWVSFGEGFEKKSLVCRKADGSYGIAIINDDVEFHGGLLGDDDQEGPQLTAISSGGWKTMGNTPQANADKSGPSIYGVTELADGTLLGAGDRALYKIKNDRIVRLLAFKNTHQLIPSKHGSYHWDWDPTDILVRGDDNYLISGTFGGVCLLYRAKNAWQFQPLDQKLGDPIVW